jgi:hypothetical protein
MGSLTLSKIDEYSLRIPVAPQFGGDRFIPMRSVGDENAQQLQYQHEEDMLKQCHTQKRKSKNRNMMSPTSPNNLGEIDHQIGMSPSNLTPGSNSKDSKGSPNEEKNKQIYKNLLAQQCLGQDVFTM